MTRWPARRRAAALASRALLTTVAALSLGLVGCSKKKPVPAPAAAPAQLAPAARATAVPETDTATRKGPVRFVVIGGGATPESTEVSLEQDVELVRRTLPGPGTVLFAGGSESRSVRELDPAPHGDALLVALGELFHPRNGRRSRYRKPAFVAERATLENVETTLHDALAEGDGPLLLYVAAHGDQGKTASDNAVALWGGRALTVARLAELTQMSRRTVRMVATSCYSGGFGELAFSHADPAQGPSGHVRCGLFSGTWDRQTSGCDPNPDRRAQESYGLHFIHALAGKDRAGTSLPMADLDFDHDGRVGLLDAHTRARIFAQSLDVPTTTSERYLREVEKTRAPIDRAAAPEDAAVVTTLGAALGYADEAAAEKRWTTLEERLDAVNDDLDDANDDLADAEGALGARLLEQWPVLDDPFHPDFAAMLASHRPDIKTTLVDSTEAHAREDAARLADEKDGEMSALELEEARLLRLRRAYETLHLASALAKRGSPAAKVYRALVECERGAP